MKKTFNSNEIVTNPAAVKGGVVKNGGITIVIVERSKVVIDNIIGKKSNIVEDNIMI